MIRYTHEVLKHPRRLTKEDMIKKCLLESVSKSALMLIIYVFTFYFSSPLNLVHRKAH